MDITQVDTGKISNLLNYDQVAALLNVHVRTVHRLASKGELSRVKITRRTLFDPKDVQSFIAKSKESKKRSGQFHI